MPPALAYSAAASATPTGARGNPARGCHASVAGSNGTAGTTWTVVVRRSPDDVSIVTDPVAASPGTTTSIAKALHDAEAGTTAGVVPPPCRAKPTVPLPWTA